MPYRDAEFSAQARELCHELNNHLAAAAAYADFLEMDVAPDKREFAHVEKLVRTLSLSRAVALELQKFLKETR